LSVFRFLTNSLLLSPPTHSSSSDAKVEWNFAFDVAVNAFFCFFLWIYLGQFVLYGLITRESVHNHLTGVLFSLKSNRTN
jgi:hypothetical protein